jgi:hypothetical protein
VLTATSGPSEPYALARSLHASQLAHQGQQPIRSIVSSAPIAADPSQAAGDIERVLHSLKVSDPELVLRAIALDHAARGLAAEALTKASAAPAPTRKPNTHQLATPHAE